MRIRRYFFPLVLALSFNGLAANPEFIRYLPARGQITSDATGNIYMYGYVDGDGIDATPGAYDTSADTPCKPDDPASPCLNGYVMKLHPDGSIAWATYLGSQVYTVEADSDGNVYAIGSGGVAATPGAAFQIGAESFVAKLNSSGSRLDWATRVPGVQSGKLALDAQRSVYVCGQAQTGKFPVTAGAFQMSPPNANDHMGVIKLSPDGSQVTYATFLAGSDTDDCASIAVDSGGNAYLTGGTESDDFPVTPGAFQTKNPFRSFIGKGSLTGTAYIAKLNPTGSALVYATYLGGAQGGAGSTIRVDSGSHAVVWGYTQAGDFPFTVSPATPGGFLTKLSADGSGLVYSLPMPWGFAPAMVLNAAGSAIVATSSNAQSSPSPAALQTCFGGGGFDTFIARVDPQGNVAEATYYGGDGYEFSYSVALGPNNSYYLLGTTSSSALGGTPDGVVFLAKILIGGGSVTAASCAAPAIQSAASYAVGPISPNEIVTILGHGLGPAEGVVVPRDANGELPTIAAGTRLFFEDEPAKLIYVSDTQINAVTPPSLIGSSVHVRIERNGTTVQSWNASVAPVAPAIFFADYGRTGGVIANQDGTLNTPANPAPIGSQVSIYFTGGGVFPSPVARPIDTVDVWIGAEHVNAVFDAAPEILPGMSKATVQVPAGCSGPGCLVELSLNGVRSGVQATIAVK